MNIIPVSRIHSLRSSLKVGMCRIQRSAIALGRTVLISTVLLIILIKTNAIKWYEDVLSHKAAMKPAFKTITTSDSAIGDLKHSRFAQVVFRALNRVPVYYRSALILSYCKTAQVFLGRKYEASEVPERFLKHASYVYGTVLVFILLSILIGANWESHYREKDDLAILDTQAINGLMFEIDEESLPHAGAGFDNDFVPITDNTDSQLITSLEDQAASLKISMLDNDNVEFELLLSRIKGISGLDEYELEERAKTEVEFLNILDRSPNIIHPLLDAYLQLPDGATKDLLRSLLATSGSLEIEQQAIEQVISGDLNNRANWLSMLRDTGIQTLDGRDALLDQLANFNEPEELSSALLSFAPQIVSATERQDIIHQLSSYLDHSDDTVRNAAVVSLSRWGDSDQSYILEQALTDSSGKVRQAAVSAAFTSTIKSDYIKTILLDIMQDDTEYWQLRMDAHNALTGYTLQGQEYDKYYQFHQEQTKNTDMNEARG